MGNLSKHCWGDISDGAQTTPDYSSAFTLNHRRTETWISQIPSCPPCWHRVGSRGGERPWGAVAAVPYVYFDIVCWNLITFRVSKRILIKNSGLDKMIQEEIQEGHNAAAWVRNQTSSGASYWSITSFLRSSAFHAFKKRLADWTSSGYSLLFYSSCHRW